MPIPPSPAVDRAIEHFAEQDQLPDRGRIAEHMHEFLRLRRRRLKDSPVNGTSVTVFRLMNDC